MSNVQPVMKTIKLADFLSANSLNNSSKPEAKLVNNNIVYDFKISDALAAAAPTKTNTLFNFTSPGTVTSARSLPVLEEVQEEVIEDTTTLTEEIEQQVFEEYIKSTEDVYTPEPVTEPVIKVKYNITASDMVSHLEQVTDEIFSKLEDVSNMLEPVLIPLDNQYKEEQKDSYSDATHIAALQHVVTKLRDVSKFIDELKQRIVV